MSKINLGVKSIWKDNSSKVDLSTYYTKEEVDNKIDNTTSSFSNEIEATKNLVEVNADLLGKLELKISDLENKITSLETSNSSLQNEIKSLRNYISNVDSNVGDMLMNLKDNYFTKTDLTNYSTPLYLASDTSIGANSSQRFYISTYSNNEIIANFTASNKRTILARGSDKRITQLGNKPWEFN